LTERPVAGVCASVLSCPLPPRRVGAGRAALAGARFIIFFFGGDLRRLVFAVFAPFVERAALRALAGLAVRLRVALPFGVLAPAAFRPALRRAEAGRRALARDPAPVFERVFFRPLVFPVFFAMSALVSAKPAPARPSCGRGARSVAGRV
jgi:hypothetical protein